MSLGRFLLLVGISTGITFAQEPPIDWKSAERQIIRLSPSTFTDLPADIRKEIDHRSCMIPQVWDDAHPHNVEQGYFTSSNAKDWIVLCSVKGVSSILVFHGGAPKPFAQLATSRDAGYLQGTLPGKAGFSHRIRAISAKDIRGYCKLWKQKCPLIAYDGIEDIFEGKASSIFYFTGGKWITLAGAD